MLLKIYLEINSEKYKIIDVDITDNIRFIMAHVDNDSDITELFLFTAIILTIVVPIPELAYTVTAAIVL